MFEGITTEDVITVQLINPLGKCFCFWALNYNKSKLKLEEVWNSWQCVGCQNSLLWNIKQTASLFKRHLSTRVKVNIHAIYSVFLCKCVCVKRALSPRIKIKQIRFTKVPLTPQKMLVSSLNKMQIKFAATQSLIEYICEVHHAWKISDCLYTACVVLWHSLRERFSGRFLALWGTDIDDNIISHGRMMWLCKGL